ncbi:MAG: hypothetical protein QM763_04255 [Agriterribacter sp.]
MNIWNYIKADPFFKDLLPDLKNFNRKIAGSNTKGAPLEFTSEEKQAISQALKAIPDLNIWRYVKADSFFRDLLPGIKNYKRKISGKNGKGNPLSFSESEMQDVSKKLDELIKKTKL